MMAPVVPAAFQELLPAAIVAVELHGCGDPAWLLRDEAECLRRAAPKRLREFAAGRHCARRGLAQFGILDFPLRAAADRQPIWPPDMIGSITHTEGYCASAVAHRQRFVGVGIDTEVVAPMTAMMRARICVPSESDWVNSLPPAQQAAAAMLIFSAKEAFYKFQFPLVGEWLDFKDVCVEPVWQAGDLPAPVVMRSTRPLALHRIAPLPLTGRYRFHQQFVSVALAMHAPS